MRRSEVSAQTKPLTFKRAVRTGILVLIVFLAITGIIATFKTTLTAAQLDEAQDFLFGVKLLASNMVSDSAENTKLDKLSIALKPGQEAEVKMTMNKNTSVTYQWVADGPVDVETHGHTVNLPRNFSIQYDTARLIQKKTGTIRPTFEGLHGWHWCNRSSNDVLIRLTASGGYRDIKRVL